MRIFYPNMYVSSLTNINIDKLKKIGIKAILFDLDNTLVPWNSNDLAKETAEWFASLQRAGFKTCILSNNSQQRVAGMCDVLAIPGLHKASKPRRRAFCRAMQMLNVKPEETAMVGDQVFTDVLGGNRLGLFTILVVPMSSHEFIGTRINRQFEKIVLRRIKHQLIQ
ncbi:YqeG family HAD IIIA-type phosphatase [Peptococcaceae bacterium 1198_IL3148]